MKTGMTLQEMAKELDRQQEAKRDFLAPSAEVSMVLDPEIAKHHKKGVHLADATRLKVNGHGDFGIRSTAHEQIAARLGIPQKYYDRMLVSAPDLLVDNANHWLGSLGERRMVRTLDGDARAFLSHRYRPLDNFDLAEVVLPTLTDNGCRVVSNSLTDTRLYIKAVTDKLTFEVKPGDVVQAGIVVSNSEIGMGSVKVEPLIFRLVCSNGMISADNTLRKYHVGRGIDIDMAEEFYRDETRKADDKAFWMKVRDVVKGAFQKEIFARIAAKMTEAASRPMDGDPVKAVEVVQRKFGLNDGERSGILTHLIKGGDPTQWGLVNAITRTSQDVPEYDRATDLERIGGAVLELPKQDWKEIAEAK